MVQWKKKQVNLIKRILRNVQIKKRIQKSPNPTVQAVKLGPLMRDQGFEPWTP